MNTNKQPKFTRAWPEPWVPKVGKFYEFFQPNSNKKEYGPVFVVSVLETQTPSSGFVWLEVKVLSGEKLELISVATYAFVGHQFHDILEPIELFQGA